MARRDDIAKQFIELADIATRAGFTGTVGVVAYRTSDYDARPRLVRVRRFWHPASIPETTQMVEWTLLVEGLGFNPLVDGQLVRMLKDDIEGWRNGNG